MLHGQPARAALLQGMQRMTGLVRPTLGPVTRMVAVARLNSRDEPPEILDDAATIVRRTIQLPDPFEDMGAMIVRHLVWRVFEETGDGGATAAVLAERLMREAVRYITAGGNPVLLKRGIERGLAVARDELRRQARPVELPGDLARLAAATVGDPRLAEMVGEVVESVGPDGAVLIEYGRGVRTEHTYANGVQWAEGYVSPFLLKNGETIVELMDPRVFVTDYALEKAEHLVPALEACLRVGGHSLLVIAPEIRDPAVSLLIVNRERGLLDGALAVKAPFFGGQRTNILEDLAVLTGARCLRRDLHDQLERVSSEDLGRARLAWANTSTFTILGGGGEKAAVRQRLATARAELRATRAGDPDRQRIEERIGKLSGTLGLIRVGAPTRSEQEELKVRLDAAVKSARLALQQGVVPGGGAALLACIPALNMLDLDGEEGIGVRILARALAEPMGAIARNAGLEPGPIVDEARRRGPGHVFDAIRRTWVEAWEAGIVDPLAVVLAALEAGVSAGATTITADVLVRRSKPPVEIMP